MGNTVTLNGNGNGLKKGPGWRTPFGFVTALAIGAFVITAGALMAYSWRQDNDRKALETETAGLVGIAARPAAQMDIVSADKAKEAQGRLQKAAEFFPAEQSASNAIQSILGVASASNVQIVMVQEKTQARQVIGDHVYYSWPFTIKAQASLEDLQTMMRRLETLEAGPLILQKINVAKGASDYTATVDMAFYTRSRTELPPTPIPTTTPPPTKPAANLGQ